MRRRDAESPMEIDFEKRVLLVAPTARDGEITRALLLKAGVPCINCGNLRRLSREVEAGAAALLVTDEVLTSDGVKELIHVLDRQPTWSDLPVVMLMRGAGQSPAATQVLGALRNVTLLERPAPMRSVLSAVQAAVRGRDRQYQIREQFVHISRGERRLARLVESNIIGVTFCDTKRVLEANDAFLKIIGYSRDDLAAGSILWRELTPPEYLALDERAIREIAEHGACMPFEKEYIRKDGTRIPVLLGIAGIEEKEARFVCFIQDLTEQKRSERERFELLESERSARKEAERAGRMKDEFLATLSHELRTPLNAILGWSQLLRRGGSSPDDLRQGLDIIERNARVQTQLIEDLLDMSRIISGKIRLEIQPVEPAAFIEAAVETVRPGAEAKGIRLHKMLDPAAGPISGDPNRLQQIVWNLLANAIKFTPRGGRVQALLERVDSHIEISVTDTGQGIPAEFLSHVFERFRQADSSMTRQHGGLGLGLAIVKHLTELHGGSVHVRSPGEGQGATFTVALPLAPVHREDASHGQAHPRTSTAPAIDCDQTSLEGLKVLVVDDESDTRDLLRRVLEECKAEVITADSAAEGLRLLRTLTPDVLVSDIGMPEVDGYEFLRRVRALGLNQNRKLPAIALTAFARSEDRTRALLAGYLVHVAKPVQPTELIATVASVAGRTGQTRVTIK